MNADDVANLREAVSLVTNRYGPFLDRESRERLLGMLSIGPAITGHEAFEESPYDVPDPLLSIDVVRNRTRLGNAVCQILRWLAHPDLDSLAPGGAPSLRAGLAEFLTVRIVPHEKFLISQAGFINLVLGLVEKSLLEFKALLDLFFRGDDHGGETCRILFGPGARFLRAAQQGERATAAPPTYVTAVFDQAAAHFDQHLLDDLSYRAPELLDRAVRQCAAGRRFAHALDIGCGTGLTGARLRDVVDRMTGVDLSPGMLNEAKRKDIYDRLIEADILDHYRAAEDTYDLILAGDVFIYFGDPDPLFEAISELARPGALVALTTESIQTESYELMSTGRFAHAPEFLRQRAATHGAREVHHEAAILRTENTRPVDGDLFVFEF